MYITYVLLKTCGGSQFQEYNHYRAQKCLQVTTSIGHKVFLMKRLRAAALPSGGDAIALEIGSGCTRNGAFVVIPSPLNNWSGGFV
jgi:hypothetical protein